MMDATAFYIHIIINLLNICDSQHGLPSSACKTKSKTLFGMFRYFCTVYGDSDDFYTSVRNYVMRGKYQWKTSSLPSWEIYTITLLQALGKFNPGIIVQCVEGD